MSWSKGKAEFTGIPLDGELAALMASRFPGQSFRIRGQVNDGTRVVVDVDISNVTTSASASDGSILSVKIDVCKRLGLEYLILDSAILRSQERIASTLEQLTERRLIGRFDALVEHPTENSIAEQLAPPLADDSIPSDD